MTIRRSSQEHIHSCLARIRAAVNWAPARDEWVATLEVFDASLADQEPNVLAEACRRLAEDQPRWPALSTILDECRKVAALRERPGPVARVAPPIDQPRVTIRDLPGMLATIADMRAHPERYAAANALIGLGEAMLERWEQQGRVT